MAEETRDASFQIKIRFLLEINCDFDYSFDLEISILLNDKILNYCKAFRCGSVDQNLYDFNFKLD